MESQATVKKMLLSERTRWLVVPFLALAPLVLLVLITGMLCLASLLLSERRRAHVIDLVRLMICLSIVIARPSSASARAFDDPRSATDPELTLWSEVKALVDGIVAEPQLNDRCVDGVCPQTQSDGDRACGRVK